MQERSLTVRRGHRNYFLKSRPQSGNPAVSFILLQGTWLETAGFIIGIPIRVQVSDRRLVITPRT